MNGQQVDDVLIALGWSTNRFAWALCISPSTVNRWIARKHEEIKIDGISKPILRTLYRELETHKHRRSPVRMRPASRSRPRMHKRLLEGDEVRMRSWPGDLAFLLSLVERLK